MKLVFIILVTGVLLAVAAPEGPPSKYHPTRLLVRPKANVSSQAVSAVHSRHGCTRLRQFPALGHLQVLTVPQGTRLKEVLAAYRNSGLFAFAEPDYARELAILPDDPLFVSGKLWGLHNTGQDGGISDADIDAPEGWDLRTSASNIVVAVLDTGIRPSHEDLFRNVWTNSLLSGFGWNALATNTSPLDDEGHGTLVAGVLGACGNNTKGIAGVAWSVQIMAGKCFDQNKLGYDSGIIACIEFARTNGARIINASLGGDMFSQALYEAIDRARQDGIIFVAAAGNNGRDIDARPYYPASFALDNIISVAFTTRKDALDSRSNFGATTVDVAAPGAAMYSTFFASDSSYLGGEFIFGSSLAAPQVAGTLALMLAQFPGATHQQIISRLLHTVDPVPSLQGKCLSGGRINLRNALSPVILPIQNRPGELRFEVALNPNEAFTLESSADLLTWSPVSTNTTTSTGFLTLTAPPTVAARAFYRVVARR